MKKPPPEQAIRISDFETVYKVAVTGDVVAIVTGYGGTAPYGDTAPVTMRSVIKDLGFVFSGQNIGAGSGLFLSKERDSNNDAYLKIKSLKPYPPIAIQSYDDHLAFYLDGGGLNTGASSGDGAAVFGYSDLDTLYFNTIQATGELVARYDTNYVVIDTVPEEFDVISSSPYALQFDAQKTYVVDSSVAELELTLDGGLKTPLVNKNGRCIFLAVPETCTKVTMPTADSVNISEKMTPKRIEKGGWNYIHLYYTSGVSSRNRTSNNSLITTTNFKWHGFDDLITRSFNKDGVAVEEGIYYKLLATTASPNTCFLNYSQQVDPLIFYSIYQ